MNIKWNKFSEITPEAGRKIFFSFEDSETVADDEVCLGEMSDKPDDIDDGQIPLVTSSGTFFYGTKDFGKWVYVNDLLQLIL